MQTCFKRIKLNPGISVGNYIGCLVHYFMLSFIFVSIDSLQPMLFQLKFQVNKKDSIQNFKNTYVIAMDIAVKLICAPVAGYLADRYGRKLVNLYGIICISAVMFAMPFAGQYWLYVILRCIYATGAIAISVMPLLADYISHGSRGTCAAFLVFMSSLGALGSAFINFSILDKLSVDNKIYYQYDVIAAMVLVIGLTYTLVCLKPGNSYYIKGENQKKNLRELLAVAKSTLKSPQITSGYTAAFLARGDSILLSLYLVLWTYSFYDHHDNKDSYNEAFTKSSMLSGIAYSVIMLTCIVYGLLYQRKNVSRAKIMIAMLIFAMLGSAMMNFSSGVSSFITYISLAVLGLGMSGLLTASLFLVNEYSTPEHRGFITGIQTFIGVLGILLQTVIGALLYEFVNVTGPFSYFSGCCLLILIITIIIYAKRDKNQEKATLIQEEHQQSYLTDSEPNLAIE